MSWSGSASTSPRTSHVQPASRAECSTYSSRAATSPSRSSADGRSSNSIDRIRSIAPRTSASSCAISSMLTLCGYAASICSRMSTALITWIGSSCRSAAIAAALGLLRLLDPLGQLAPLLERAAQHLEAPAQTLLGLHPLGDVEHEPLPEPAAVLLGTKAAVSWTQTHRPSAARSR